ncbi:MAG TPA: helix-turn-helix domain-containing protein [Methanomicrobia archaeon]|nr:helix-turn-helix domain-containing protein [Methanomicrobia archaeon]
MTAADELLTELFVQDQALSTALTRAIKQKLGLSVGEFSAHSGIPASTLYKILSGARDPNLRTFRRILNTIRAIEGVEAKTKQKFIAIVGTRSVLDEIEQMSISVDTRTIDIKEYAVTGIEEAIISAIQAERDGAAALVCAPIVSSTIEKVLTIPVATIRPKSSITRALELVARKIS